MLEEFAGHLGHDFADLGLLEAAMIHRSYTAEHPQTPDNERMEFLGDAVLQFAVTQHLYDNHPELREGQMAKVRAACVSGEQLAIVAAQLGLGPLVRMGSGEAQSGGRKKQSILADSMEAVLAAVYLDAGIERAIEVVLAHWTPIIEQKAADPGRRDYKTRLQEQLAAGGQRPEYHVEGSGPDHERTFVAEVRVAGEVVGSGTGNSKKRAQQEAARAALGE